MKPYKQNTICILLIIVLSTSLFAGGAAEDPLTNKISALPKGHPLTLWEETGNPGGWKIKIEPDGTAVLTDSLDNRLKLQQMDQFVITSGGAIETFYMLNAEETIAAIGTSAEVYGRKKKLPNSQMSATWHGQVLRKSLPSNRTL